MKKFVFFAMLSAVWAAAPPNHSLGNLDDVVRDLKALINRTASDLKTHAARVKQEMGLTATQEEREMLARFEASVESLESPVFQRLLNSHRRVNRASRPYLAVTIRQFAESTHESLKEMGQTDPNSGMQTLATEWARITVRARLCSSQLAR